VESGKMGEKKASTFDELFVEVGEFQKTVDELKKNLQVFKDKLLANKKKYGTDMLKWPEK
jgi:hypothetical protein